MFASKQKKELVYACGRLQGMSARDDEELNGLANLPPVVSDEEDRPQRVLVPDDELLARRAAWDELTDAAVATRAEADEVLTLIAEYPRPRMVPQELVRRVEQLRHNSVKLVFLSAVSIDIIDAARAGMTIEAWMERKAASS